MARALILIAVMMIASGVQAEIFKCTTPSGETEYSDTPCKAGTSSEVLPDRDPVSMEEQNAARARLEAQKQKITELETQRTAEEHSKRTQDAPPPSPIEEVYGGGCSDHSRGRETNCADIPYRRPPPDRPIIRPGPRPMPR